jgi:glutamate N-acetyltransferase/amino-acid N-acetyltransferase
MPDIHYRESDVTWPAGFRAAGAACGIKQRGVPDLALLISDRSCSAAGVFTKNRCAAAPVVYSRNLLKRRTPVRAVIANSGNANAGSGRFGEEVVRRTVSRLAAVLDIPPREVLVCSTGSIGKKLPVHRLERALPGLCRNLSAHGGKAFSRSIMTTDAFPKRRAAEFRAGGRPVRIGASAKGAGMIEPSMATMLCFITTDAALPRNLLKKLLVDAVSRSFNRISVDGDQSTNDTVLALSNGASGVSIRSERDPAYKPFRDSLFTICRDLAEKMVSDGEGATKRVSVNVRGARSDSEAKKICRAVTNSLLFKCALFGDRPYWGRVLSGAGASGATIDPGRLCIELQGVKCFDRGEPDFDAARKLGRAMRKKEIHVLLDCGAGKSAYSMLGTDLSFDYVELNRS